ncbi:Crp/Fnr family transcriptional regulator [bacterium]|nr:Crp/Fnr family transcriptional regulator [bacterium]
MLSIQELKQFKFFNGLDDAFLEKIQKVASLKAVKKGDYVFKENEDANCLCIVKTGSFALETTLYGEQTARLATTVKDDYFGWSSMVEPYKTTASRLALQDSVLLVLDTVILREMCKQDTELGYFLMSKVAKMISIQLKKTREQLIHCHWG